MKPWIQPIHIWSIHFGDTFGQQKIRWHWILPIFCCTVLSKNFSLNSFSFCSNSLYFYLSSSVMSDSGLFIQSSRIYSDCNTFLSFFKLSSVPPSIVFRPRYPTLSPLRAASRSSSLLLFSSSSARSSFVKYFSTFISFSTSIVRMCSGFSNIWLYGSNSVSYCFKLYNNSLIYSFFSFITKI